MDTTSTSTLPAAGAPATSTVGSPGAGSSSTPAQMNTSISSDYQMFLNMMTTELQNQDPMNPMSSDQFAVELATFSGVEQQLQTNDLLTQLLASSNGQSMVQMAGWVGDEARVTAPVYFDGSPVTLSPKPAAGADKATLVVTDPTGAQVDRRDIDPTSANYQWDGKDSNGNTLPTGIYNLTLESYQGDQKLDSSPVDYYAPVQEIRSESTGVNIVVPGDIEVPSDRITAIRQPSDAGTAAVSPATTAGVSPSAVTSPTS